MSARERFAPEEQEPDVETYDVAPPDMPPAPAGANAEIGGEAAASRRLAGLPPELARERDHDPDTPPSPEPFLGYDSLPLDDLLDWIEEEEPGPEDLHQIIEYEEAHRGRETIIDECRGRLERWRDSD